MARRSRPPQPPKSRPELARPLSETTDLLQEQLSKGSDLLRTDVGSREELGQVKRRFRNWEEYVQELLRRLFSTEELSDEFGASVRMMYSLGPSSLQEDIGDFRSDGGIRVRRLESIIERLPLFAAREGPRQEHEAASAGAPVRRAFIVHGREQGPRDAIRNFLRDLDVEPVVLEDQPNQGRTIIEKFEASVDVGFAVIVLTPDDIGAAKDEKDEARPRARQNVLLELGFFIGLLGRARVAPLKIGDVEVPSDVDGIVYIDYDPGGAWKLRLAKELKAAGIEVDMNRAI